MDIQSIKIRKSGDVEASVKWHLFDEVVTIPKNVFESMISQHMGIYDRPKQFAFFLGKFPSFHKNSAPPEVIHITEKFCADEIESFKKALEEQLSMNRKVVLIYTRKSVVIGYTKKGYLN